VRPYRPMTRSDDAWGEAVRVLHLRDPGAVRAIIERDDGFVDAIALDLLVAPPSRWPSYERTALRYARGRVLDVGCGAGRHALDLQRRGLDVVAIDPSKKAVAVARERGVRDARRLALNEVSKRLGVFDTVLLLGNNFGLFEGPTRIRSHLRRLAKITTDGARIIATTLDPYVTDAPEHRHYHRRNRARGRLGGQIRMRVRYRALVDPWFDYLYVSTREMVTLLRGTGWEVRRSFGAARPNYAVVIEKARARRGAR
jgi:SAM-dependent methyltransferase